MKWPFVRRSKHKSIIKERDEQKGYKEWWTDKSNNLLQVNALNMVEINRLNQENQELMEDIGKLINDTNRLNLELANEMNSHRETKEMWQESLAHNDLFLSKIKDLEKELEETKDALKIAQEEIERLMQDIYDIGNDLAKEMNSHKETKKHEQKLFEAHDKLNQQNMSLIFENEKLSKQNNQLIIDKNHLKSKIKRLDSLLTNHKLELESAKSHVNWFYGNYARFKDMIEKSGYYKKL